MATSLLNRLETRYWTARRQRRPGPRPRAFAVVTGGSEGIGLALAERLIAAGQDVLIVARNEIRLAEARLALDALGPGQIETLALDICTADAGRRIEARLAELDGWCSALVNNAGIGLSGEFDSHSGDDIQRLIDLNVGALSRLVRHFLPAMRAARQGVIMNVASMGGFVPGPYQAAYYASKAFVISLSEALAAEVTGDGVRVIAVAPGPVATRFHRRMGSEADFYVRLVPVQRAQTVARYAMVGLMLRQRVSIPGPFQTVMGLLLRFLPHRLTVPIVDFLLEPRGR